MTVKGNVVNISAEVTGPSVGLNFSEKGSFLEASVIKGGAIELSAGGAKAGVSTGSLGVVSLSLDKPKDGLKLDNIKPGGVTLSSNTKVSLEQSSTFGSSSTEVGIGAKLVIVYGEVKANIAQAKEAVQNWAEATKNYFRNYFKETTNNTHR